MISIFVAFGRIRTTDDIYAICDLKQAGIRVYPPLEPKGLLS